MKTRNLSLIVHVTTEGKKINITPLTLKEALSLYAVPLSVNDQLPASRKRWTSYRPGSTGAETKSLTAIDKMLNVEKIQALKDLAEEMDDGYINTIFVTYNETITFV